MHGHTYIKLAEKVGNVASLPPLPRECLAPVWVPLHIEQEDYFRRCETLYHRPSTVPENTRINL